MKKFLAIFWALASVYSVSIWCAITLTGQLWSLGGLAATAALAISLDKFIAHVWGKL